MFRIKSPFQLQLYIHVCALNERQLVTFKTERKETQQPEKMLFFIAHMVFPIYTPAYLQPEAFEMLIALRDTSACLGLEA